MYSKVCTQDLFESDLVRYTNMDMTVRNEEIYTYRFPEMGFPCGSAGKESACNAGPATHRMNPCNNYLALSVAG